MVRGRKVTEATEDPSDIESQASPKNSSNALPVKENSPKEEKKIKLDSQKPTAEESNTEKPKDTEEKAEEETVPTEKKRVYTLRRSTIVSSSTVPWCQRFPPQTSKSANAAQPKASTSNSNSATCESSKPKKFKYTPREIPEQAKTSTKSKRMNIKFLPVSSPYRTLDEEEVPLPKMKSKKKKKRTEFGQKRAKAKLTPSVTPQPRISGEGTSTMKQQANFQKYLYMGYDYDSCITANADNTGPSTSSNLNEFPNQSKDVKRTTPMNPTPEQYESSELSESSESSESSNSSESDDESPWKRKGGKQGQHSNAEKDSSEESSEESSLQEKKTKLEVAPFSLKIRVQPDQASSFGRATAETKEYHKEKKVRLITPYQILKGKESKSEKPTSIILKRTAGIPEKHGKSSHDWKGKLVTPSQILKGKVKQDEASLPKSPKRSEVRFNYEQQMRYEDDAARRAIEGETSTAYLGQRKDDDGRSFYNRRWRDSDSSCDSDSFDSYPERGKVVEAPHVSGKYEADTTTATTSHSLGIEGDEDTDEEMVERRAKKKKIKISSERRTKKEKKEKSKKRRRKRKEKLVQDDKTITSSHEDKDRAAVNMTASE